MGAREIDKAKAFAAIFSGIVAVAAAGAASWGYTLAAIIAGGCLIALGIMLAAEVAAWK
jgi:hypothetical protein